MHQHRSLRSASRQRDVMAAGSRTPAAQRGASCLHRSPPTRQGSGSSSSDACAHQCGRQQLVARSTVHIIRTDWLALGRNAPPRAFVHPPVLPLAFLPAVLGAPATRAPLGGGGDAEWHHVHSPGPAGISLDGGLSPCSYIRRRLAARSGAIPNASRFWRACLPSSGEPPPQRALIALFIYIGSPLPSVGKPCSRRRMSSWQQSRRTFRIRAAFTAHCWQEDNRPQVRLTWQGSFECTTPVPMATT
eukprot:1196329-Prorocentrum_minimum.AAC.4